MGTTTVTVSKRLLARALFLSDHVTIGHVGPSFSTPGDEFLDFTVTGEGVPNAEQCKAIVHQQEVYVEFKPVAAMREA